MDSSDITVRVLQDIREEIRGQRSDHQEMREELLRSHEAMFARIEQLNQSTDARFEVLETTLRDLAEQLVMLARGVKVAVEHRSDATQRIDGLALRLDRLEKRVGV